MSVQLWNQLTTTDFDNMPREKTLVLLPMGSTEQHGPHLPVGTDYFLVEGTLKRVLPRIGDLDVVVLPSLWCTRSEEHQKFRGTLYLHSETLMAVMHDLAEGISLSGFKKLVIMNWHGGNSGLVNALAYDIRSRHGLAVFVIDVVYSFDGVLRVTSGAPAPSFDIHAGRYETGMMLADLPGLVKPGPYDAIGSDLERGKVAAGFSGYELLLPEGGPVHLGWETDDISTDGVVGNPAGSTAQEGEHNWQAMTGRVEALLREIAHFAYPS